MHCDIIERGGFGDELVKKVPVTGGAGVLEDGADNQGGGLPDGEDVGGVVQVGQHEGVVGRGLDRVFGGGTGRSGRYRSQG